MILTDENFHMYAAKHYNNPDGMSLKDFDEDLGRIRSIQKMFNRFDREKSINFRLLLNHIITLHTVFGLAAVELLFYKVDSRYHSHLKSFLVFLNTLPPSLEQFQLDAIQEHSKIKQELEQI